MIRKVRRDTLSQQVTENLIALIDAQHLTPGDSLPSESSLAESFGVSRPVIREALKALQGEGVIEIVTGKNAVVRPFSSAVLSRAFERAILFKSATLPDLVEVRRGLEIQSAVLAAERCTGEDVAALEATLANMAVWHADLDRFAEEDVRFHLKIAVATRNPMLYYLIESIRDAMRDSMLASMRRRFSEREFDLVLSKHEAILQALRDRNPVQAQAAMREHLDEALRGLGLELE